MGLRTALFKGTCQKCGSRIERGETIDWQGTGKIDCYRCAGQPINAPPPPPARPARPARPRPAVPPRAASRAARAPEPERAACYCATVRLAGKCPVCGREPGARAAPPPPSVSEADKLRAQAKDALREATGKASGYTFAEKCGACRRLFAMGQKNAAAAFLVGLAELPDKQAILARLGEIDRAAAARGYLLAGEEAEREVFAKRAVAKLGFDPRVEPQREPPREGGTVIPFRPAPPPAAPTPPATPPEPPPAPPSFGGPVGALPGEAWHVAGGDWKGLWQAVADGHFTVDQATELARQWQEAGL